MIGKLKGRVDSCLPDHVIVDVGGVGYLVYCSRHTLDKLSQNQSCELYTITHVREDHIHLYGFITAIEKDFFSLLQTVNGIGVRMALTILSGLTPEQIQLAIVHKNKEAFKAISGVGAKMAERILIELQDKIKASVVIAAGSLDSATVESETAQDAISALVYLGINKHTAQNTIYNILSQNPDIRTNELIKLALQERKL